MTTKKIKYFFLGAGDFEKAVEHLESNVNKFMADLYLRGVCPDSIKVTPCKDYAAVAVPRNVGTIHGGAVNIEIMGQIHMVVQVEWTEGIC
jgi:hypothetical protein